MRNGTSRRFALVAVPTLFGLALVGLRVLGANPAVATAARPPELDAPMQGVTFTGLITYGTGTCFPDAVLLDCAGQVAHELRGPGGAAFFSPYIGQHVQVNGAVQECQPGFAYMDVINIVTVADTCGAPPTVTPGGPTATPGGPTPPPPPGPTATPGPSPTPGGAGNLALGKQLFASSTIPPSNPNFGADGDPNTFWVSASGRDPYYAARNVQWIYVDLGADYSVADMRMRWNAAQWQYPRGYAVYAWLDYCGGWCIIASTSRGDGDDSLPLLQPLEARYWMLWLVNPALIGNGYQLGEWDINGTATILSTNVAAGKAAVALNHIPGYEASMATDANDATEWRSTTIPSWIYVNFGTGVTVDRARIKWAAGQHATAYALYAWNGIGWAPLTQKTGGGGGDEMVRFPTVRTQYILLNSVAGPGPSVGVREFEVYEVAPTGPIAPPVAPLGGIWTGLSGGGRPQVMPQGVAHERAALSALGAGAASVLIDGWDHIGQAARTANGTVEGSFPHP